MHSFAPHAVLHRTARVFTRTARRMRANPVFPPEADAEPLSWSAKDRDRALGQALATDFDLKELPPGLTIPEFWAKLPGHAKGAAGLVGLFVKP